MAKLSDKKVTSSELTTSQINISEGTGTPLNIDNSSKNTGGTFPSGYYSGQTFTVGANDYNVNSIDVYLVASAARSGNITMEVWAATGDVPDNSTVLAVSDPIDASNVTVNGTTNATTATALNFTFPTPPTLTASTQYSFVFKNTSNGSIFIARNNGNIYTGGRYGFAQTPFDVAAFTPNMNPGEDMTFTIYGSEVTPANLDFVGSAGQKIDFTGVEEVDLTGVTTTGLPAGGDSWSDPVDSDVIPDGNQTRDLGSDAARFDRIHGQVIRASSSYNVTSGISSVGEYKQTQTGASGGVRQPALLGRSTVFPMGVLTLNSSSATASQSLLIETGNNTSTGDSGDLTLYTGTVTSGTRGNIILKDGSEGTAGHVWTSTGTSGEGNWAAPAGGGISNVVEDTTPQLGGTLDALTNDIRNVNDIHIGSNSAIVSGARLAITGSNLFRSMESVTTGSQSSNYMVFFNSTNSATSYFGVDGNGLFGAGFVDEFFVGTGSNKDVKIMRNSAEHTRFGATDTTIASNILPDTDGTRNIGSTSNRYNKIFLDNFMEARGIILDNTSGTQLGIIGAGNATLPSGKLTSSNGAYWRTTQTTASGSNIGIYTLNSSSTTAKSWDVYIETGNKTNSSGNQRSGDLEFKTGNLTNAANGSNSGNIQLETGTVAGAGSRGNIILKDGSEGTVGHVWTSTGTGGEGNWAAPAGGGDAWSDPVDSNINPDTANTRWLGDNSNQFGRLHSNRVYSNQYILNTTSTGTGFGGKLEASTGTTSPEGTNVGLYLNNNRASSSQTENSVAIFSNNEGGTRPSGHAIVATGNTADGNSGNVILATGDPSGTGNRGIIKIKDGSEGTVGHVFMSDQNDGTGSWQEYSAPNGGTLTLAPLDLTPDNGLKVKDNTNTARAVVSIVDGTALTADYITWTNNTLNVSPGQTTTQSVLITSSPNLETSLVSSGDVLMSSAISVAANTGRGGLASGDVISSTVALSSGDINVASGKMSDATGSVRADGQSGDVNLITGDNNSATLTTGDITLTTGTNLGAGGRGDITMNADRVDASASTGPFRAPNLTADPGSPQNGDIWYNTTSNQLKCRANGVTVVLA